MVSGAMSAAQTRNWGGFAGAVAGGMIGGWAGGGLAGQLAGTLGNSAFTFAGGFAIGAVEMGLGGFGAGFGGALGSGASMGQALKAGAIGGAIGAVTGRLMEGSYLAGWQHSLHGMDYNQVGKASGVQRQLSVSILERDLPGKALAGDGARHWGLQVSDNYNESILCEIRH